MTNGFDEGIRPDRGRFIWERRGTAAACLDRALGVTYLKGLWEALRQALIPLPGSPFAAGLSGRRIDSCPHFLHNLQRIAQN